MATTVEPVFADVCGWRCLYVDLPGTGASPPGEPRSDVVLDEVVGTIRAALGDKPFAIAGWSYGGYLAAGVTSATGAESHVTRSHLYMCIFDVQIVHVLFRSSPRLRDTQTVGGDH